MNDNKLVLLKQATKYCITVIVLISFFTMGTSTEFVNAMYLPYENKIKDAYTDNILTTGSVIKNQQTLQYYDNKVIAKITGECANKILNAIEDGNCLTFRVQDINNDDKDDNLVIEIVQIDKHNIDLTATIV
jgi:hypothetical protein